MTQLLDYARPGTPRRSKTLARFATASLFFPLLAAGCLYGEWLLAWWALGHRPRPSLDDPASVAGSSWMFGITTLALFGSSPAACILSLAHVVVNRPPVRRSAMRLVVLLAGWGTLFILLRWDPGRVLYWWLD